MSDQTQASLSTQGEIADDATLGTADRAILRRLAGRVAELAARPIEQTKRDLWTRHNTTIRNDPRRVVRWVEIARQEAEAL